MSDEYVALAWDHQWRPARRVRLGGEEHDAVATWWDGSVVAPRPPEQPYRFFLEPFDEEIDSLDLPYVLGQLCPLVAPAFADALADFGVDTIDRHAVLLIDEGGPVPEIPYAAITVHGLIDAVDAEASLAEASPGGAVLDVAFDRLVLDPAKANGLALFRLVQNPGHLWIHRELDHFLRARGFVDHRTWRTTQVSTL